ncbi:MAG: arsenate reductase (glutaredoxin) [Gammaproteobacteria bacterium]
MPDTVILHNPRCSKSRSTLKILDEQGADYEIVEYLKTPPDAARIEQILELLALEPRDLMRKGEQEYKDLGLADASLGRDALIAAMAANPKLIERPIVIRDGKAVIGRPPERVLELLS